jgi:hypothetical protein
VPFQVSTIRSGVTRLYDSANATFSVQAADAMGAGVLMSIQALVPATAPQRNARDRAAAGVQSGLSLMSQAKYPDAVSQFLLAADNLETITTVPVADALLGVSKLVAEAEAHQCNSLPSCTTASPKLVNDGYFTAFNTTEGVEARGGNWGDTDWEWGLGSDTTSPGSSATGQLVWSSGKQYAWTLSYDGAGNGTVAVLDGATTLLTTRFQAGSASKLRTGNAVQIEVRATAAAGLAKVDASVTKLQGQWVAGAQTTRGDGYYSEGQLTYLLPATGGGLSAAGTLRLSFSDLTPPSGDALRFRINAGNSACRTQ